ncbi:hypothetical protein FACS1894217_11270 [Clostridia bacterium]|nr:hypothetical protein FACS1894217_11270 [Clostridia bacterium]
MKREGSALTVVLVFLLVSVVLGSAIMFALQEQNRSQKNIAGYEQDYYDAESAVQWACSEALSSVANLQAILAAVPTTRPVPEAVIGKPGITVNYYMNGKCLVLESTVNSRTVKLQTGDLSGADPGEEAPERLGGFPFKSGGRIDFPPNIDAFHMVLYDPSDDPSNDWEYTPVNKNYTIGGIEYTSSNPYLKKEGDTETYVLFVKKHEPNQGDLRVRPMSDFIGDPIPGRPAEIKAEMMSKTYANTIRVTWSDPLVVPPEGFPPGTCIVIDSSMGNFTVSGDFHGVDLYMESENQWDQLAFSGNCNLEGARFVAPQIFFIGAIVDVIPDYKTSKRVECYATEQANIYENGLTVNGTGTFGLLLWSEKITEVSGIIAPDAVVKGKFYAGGVMNLNVGSGDYRSPWDLSDDDDEDEAGLEGLDLATIPREITEV